MECKVCGMSDGRVQSVCVSVYNKMKLNEFSSCGIKKSAAVLFAAFKSTQTDRSTIVLTHVCLCVCAWCVVSKV